MPTYRLTIDAHRFSTGESRRIVRYIKAVTPEVARRSLGNRPIQDMADMAWFDEWRIVDTRKAKTFEVVTTDNSAWHSHGLTGITVFHGKREAKAYFRRVSASRKPGQNAYIREVKP